jgi:hypothetical protein
MINSNIERERSTTITRSNGIAIASLIGAGCVDDKRSEEVNMGQ